MPLAEIADALGLRSDLAGEKRNMIAAGVLELLAKSGRIVWDAEIGATGTIPTWCEARQTA